MKIKKIKYAKDRDKAITECLLGTRIKAIIMEASKNDT